MDQARAIKRKRELAQELGNRCLFLFLFLPRCIECRLFILEDVQSFAKSIEANPSRSRKATKATESSGPEDEDGKDKPNDGSDGEESDEAPKRRSVSLSLFLLFILVFEMLTALQTNARRSIMAFLQDQSSDDE
jgi:hypothetical protein